MSVLADEPSVYSVLRPGAGLQTTPRVYLTTWSIPTMFLPRTTTHLSGLDDDANVSFLLLPTDRFLTTDPRFPDGNLPLQVPDSRVSRTSYWGRTCTSDSTTSFVSGIKLPRGCPNCRWSRTPRREGTLHLPKSLVLFHGTACEWGLDRAYLGPPPHTRLFHDSCSTSTLTKTEGSE